MMKFKVELAAKMVWKWRRKLVDSLPGARRRAPEAVLQEPAHASVPRILSLSHLVTPINLKSIAFTLFNH